MHKEYQHPSIQLFMMSPKPSDSMNCNSVNVKVGDTTPTADEDDGSSSTANEVDDVESDQIEDESTSSTNPQDKTRSDWEVRRCGAMAARLLRDVKIA